MALARHVAYVHRNLKNPEDSQAVRGELPARQMDGEVLTIGRCGMSHGGNGHVQPVVIAPPDVRQQLPEALRGRGPPVRAPRAQGAHRVHRQRIRPAEIGESSAFNALCATHAQLKSILTSIWFNDACLAGGGAGGWIEPTSGQYTCICHNLPSRMSAPPNWTEPGVLWCLVVEQKIVNDQTTMTPRQLLSILRLSQALARLRFSNAVRRPTLVLLIAA